MHLRADFLEPAIVRPGDEAWRPSPTAGVERCMLDRIGDEVARATSLVRYAPNSSFPHHVHGGGEEFLVLEGQFMDAQGAYGPGTYVRNPIGTSHAPSAGPAGALLFVKLHQFSAQDTQRIVIDTKQAQWLPGLVDGLSVLPLHAFAGEHVALVRWAPNTRFNPHKHWGGEEILVLEGFFEDERGQYPAGTWLRSPHLSAHTPFTGPQGTLIYVKTGHLPVAKAED